MKFCITITPHMESGEFGKGSCWEWRLEDGWSSELLRRGTTFTKWGAKRAAERTAKQLDKPTYTYKYENGRTTLESYDAR